MRFFFFWIRKKRRMQQGDRQIDLKKAFEAENAEVFLFEVFPDKWHALAARILESGADFSKTMGLNEFAPGWTMIPYTVRYSKKGDANETYFKSMIFRVHDFLHQLWGLPVPTDLDFTDDREREYFKRMWMCAEVAVLTIVEFFYCQWLYDTQPHLKQYLIDRNTLAFKRTTELRDKTMEQTALRLDALLHKKTRPRWVRENEAAVTFVTDFGEMLEYDRVNIDHNWKLLVQQEAKQYLFDLPNQSYGENLDGAELTTWMIRHFEHYINTSSRIDRPLQEFNHERRRKVNLPKDWNSAPAAPKHTPPPPETVVAFILQ